MPKKLKQQLNFKFQPDKLIQRHLLALLWVRRELTLVNFVRNLMKPLKSKLVILSQWKLLFMKIDHLNLN